MPGEQETLSAESPDLAATQTESPEAEQDELLTATEETEALEGEQPEETVDEDSEEFDWEGKKVRGPKGLKEGVLRHADYTRKTQELASERQQVQQARQAVEQLHQRSEEELKTHASLINITEQLEQYNQLSERDWQEWEGRDFMAAQAGFRQFQQLQSKYYATAQQLQQLQTARTEQAQSESQQALIKRLQETRDYATKNIKGWSPQMDEQLRSFAMDDLGLDHGLVSQHMSPQILRALHLAWVGSQALKKPATPAQQPPPQPTKTVSGKSSASPTGLDDRLSSGEWLKRRNAQLASRR